MHAIDQLEEFLQDIPFPIDREGLLHEAFDSPLSNPVREAIALLPDQEYRSKDEVKMELVGIPEDDPHTKKDIVSDELEDDVPPTEPEEPPQVLREEDIEEEAE